MTETKKTVGVREFTTEENINYFKELVDKNVKFTANQLRELVLSTIDDLQVVVKRIDNGHLHTINSLGELQTRGHRIDLLCAELGATLKAQKEFTELVFNGLTEEEPQSATNELIFTSGSQLYAMYATASNFIKGATITEKALEEFVQLVGGKEKSQQITRENARKEFKVISDVKLFK